MTQLVVVVFLKMHLYLHKETISCFKLTSLCAGHKCAVDDSFQRLEEYLSYHHQLALIFLNLKKSQCTRCILICEEFIFHMLLERLGKNLSLLRQCTRY